MTDTTPAQGAPKGFPTPLWTRDDLRLIALEIDADVHARPDPHSTELMVVAMQRLRDDYEATLSSLYRQLQDCGWKIADREMTINAIRAKLVREPATFDALGRYLYGEQEANNAE